jgi:hypothetical protein
VSRPRKRPPGAQTDHATSKRGGGAHRAAMAREVGAALAELAERHPRTAHAVVTILDIVGGSDRRQATRLVEAAATIVACFPCSRTRPARRAP